MSVFVAVNQVDKVFSLSDGGEYVALKDIDLEVRKGEFVSVARALAIRPKLLLDEPFAALDALTRGNLQEQLMRIYEENHVTAMMVTQDLEIGFVPLTACALLAIAKLLNLLPSPHRAELNTPSGL